MIKRRRTINWRGLSLLLLANLIWLALAAAAISSGPAAAQSQPSGYWEREKVDIVKELTPDDPPDNRGFVIANKQASLSDGSATVTADFNGNNWGDIYYKCIIHFESSYSWNSPPSRLTPGDKVTFNLNAANLSTANESYCNYGGGPNIYVYLHVGGYSGGAIAEVVVSRDIGSPPASSSTEWIVPDEGGEPLDLVFSVNTHGFAGTAHVVYSYKWQAGTAVQPESDQPEPNPPTPTETIPIWQVVIDVGGVLGGLGGLAVAGGILATAVSNILSASRSQQPEGQEQDPNQVAGYILQLSSDTVMLTPQQPASVSAAVWQVTADGATARAPDAAIRVDVPGTAAGFLQVTPTNGQGQITCNFTQVGQPSQSEVLVTFNASAAQGGASAQVRASFEVELAAYSSQPVIRYYTGDKRWGAPDLAVYFHAPGDNTPVRVPFKYGFPDPNAIFTADPDILVQEEAYSPDDGLTWQVKMKLKEGVDLEEVFGEDLSKNDGKVTIKVMVVREDQKVDTAATTYQLRPEVALFVYGYVQDTRNRNLDKRLYQNVELDEMEFAADGTDQLELGAVFLRTDKEVEPGNEYAERVDVATIKHVAWKGQEESWGFKPLEVVEQATGDGVFGYRIGAQRALLSTPENLGRKPSLHFEVALKPNAPRTYSLLASGLDVKLAPQHLYLKLIVVPSDTQNRATAVAYVCLTKDANIGLEGVALMLDVEPTGGKDFLIARQPVARTNVKGLATWELVYNTISWQEIELGKAQCKVHCGIVLEDQEEPAETTWREIDLRANFRRFTERFQADAAGLKLNNPAFASTGGWRVAGALWPDSLSGPLNNLLDMCGYAQFRPYVCGEMRDRIWNWAIKRRYSPDMDTRMEMNGIESAKYAVSPVHVFFGFYPSGQPFNGEDPYFLDPWWDQAYVEKKVVHTWTDESSKSLAAFALVVSLVSIPLWAGGAIAFVRAFLARRGISIALETLYEALRRYLLIAFLGGEGATIVIGGGDQFVPKLERTTNVAESGFTDGRTRYNAPKQEIWKSNLQWARQGFPKVDPVTQR